MPTSSFVLDSPIPPQLDLAGAPSQLFLPPNPSASSALFRSIAIPSRKRQRGVDLDHRSWLESPSSPTSFISPDDRLAGVDDVSADHDYRPSRYRDPPLKLPLDSSVESLSEASGARRKRSRRDPSSVVAPSPSGPEDEKLAQSTSFDPQVAPVRWSRAVLDVVGKVWDFCWSGAFRGFYAGGGRGYSMTAGGDPSLGEDYSWQPTEKPDFLSSMAAATTAPQDQSGSTLLSGDCADDDLHRNWVVVGHDEHGYEASPSTQRRVHRRTSSYSHLRRRQQPVKRTFVSQPPSISAKSHFSAPAKPRESPVSVETQRYMAQKRRIEREEDESLARLNRQLQAMIKEGKQALGTRVEVDDYMED
ncbi:hypothetical protein BBP40_004350 [Aspergillus hancockii]|nr:hypothetical protein BBP40_004350 [Aspergillus hancockii]